MPEYETLIHIDGDTESYNKVVEHLRDGWELRSGTYPVFGSDKVRYIQLVKYLTGDPRPEDELRMTSDMMRYHNVIQVIQVPWPVAKTLDELDEASKELANELLNNRGWEIVQHWKDKCAMVLRTDPDTVSVQLKKVEPAIAPAPEEAEKEPVVEPANEDERTIAPETTETDVIQIKTASGEVVETLDAGPEAVAKAEKTLDAAYKEDIPAATPEYEYNEEELGCLGEPNCKYVDECTPKIKAIHYTTMYETGNPQCRSYDDPDSPKEEP